MFTVLLQRESNLSSMIISLTPDGKIIIQDFSVGGDKDKFIQELRELGVDVEIISDSPCG